MRSLFLGANRVLLPRRPFLRCSAPSTTLPKLVSVGVTAQNSILRIERKWHVGDHQTRWPGGPFGTVLDLNTSSSVRGVGGGGGGGGGVTLTLSDKKQEIPADA